MSVKDFIFLVINVLKNWKVDVTIVAMLFVMWFANFIITYRRRPKRVKKNKRISSPAPAQPAPAAASADNAPAMSEKEAAN